MRFTDSPFEAMMKQKLCSQDPSAPKAPRDSQCSGCPYWRGIGCVSWYRELMRAGDGLARELTREEKLAISALVTKWCANYDREYGCLPLEYECYMFWKCWTGAYCRYF